ncbi:hypothetical protein [Kitasatospora sp. NPDC050543]|uniref:hypothetical protein n=1 Tax=Kitasatospora sp. NPDC050543 TaxID=3364054 RepID=UPI00378D4375
MPRHGRTARITGTRLADKVAKDGVASVWTDEATAVRAVREAGRLGLAPHGKVDRLEADQGGRGPAPAAPELALGSR